MKRNGRRMSSSSSTIIITPTTIHDDDNTDAMKFSNTTTNTTTTKRRRSSRLISIQTTTTTTTSSNDLNNSFDHPFKMDTNSASIPLTDDIPKHQTIPRHSSELYPPQVPSSMSTVVSSIASNYDITTYVPSMSSSLSLLNAWIHHTDISFHYFTPTEVQQIQYHLLTWYRQHRRKLPWRGDAPPWNGSTINFITSTTLESASTTTKSTRKKTIKNVDIKNVAIPVSNTTSTSMMDNNNNNDTYMHRTYPITTYGIWVSEIMLQQTRVEAVIPKWCQFISTFPNITALANADLEQVNAIWAGLGYYRRLKLLHTAAQIVVTKYNGIIPNTIHELLTLPGIGKYTAHAIMSIAYQQPNTPVVDGNVCRVLSRLRCIAQNIKSPIFKDQYGWMLAQQLVASSSSRNTCSDPNSCDDVNVVSPVTTSSNNDDGRSIPTADPCSTNNTDLIVVSSGDMNQALMELGATYCAPSGSGIHPDDPLKEFYWSTKLGRALADVINSFIDQNDTTTSLLDSILTKSTSITEKDDNTDGPPCCPLCAKYGVHDIITQFRNQLMTTIKVPNVDPIRTNNVQYHDAVQQLGHSLFPLPPPKVHKKEEIIVIAAICRFLKNNDTAIDDDNDSSNVTKQWLLVKRLDDGGLLSGQWEFPSISVWQSEEEQKSKSKGGSGRRSTPRKDMSDDVPSISVSQRRKHIRTVLTSLGGIVRNPTLQTITDEPIHHIFSHIRHTMYIEYMCVDGDWTKTDDNSKDQSVVQNEWKSQADMDQIGITSGVKKVLQTIEKELGKN